MTGRCLCGGVTVRLSMPTDEVGVCHCRLCRRWGGGPWMAVQVPGSEITGETLVVYRSSSFAERGFCGRCGSHVFHRPRQGPELAISTGLLENPDFRIAREIFDDARPPFYRFEADSVKRSGLSMALEWLPKLIGRRLGLR
ncbi:hypothetical protein IP78_13160 [Brevundimonas sp. AAP58]|nr:hypothetical protein IP78_13160 [Brevundimonas sp. AAP58]